MSNPHHSHPEGPSLRAAPELRLWPSWPLLYPNPSLGHRLSAGSSQPEALAGDQGASSCLLLGCKRALTCHTGRQASQRAQAEQPCGLHSPTKEAPLRRPLRPPASNVVSLSYLPGLALQGLTVNTVNAALCGPASLCVLGPLTELSLPCWVSLLTASFYLKGFPPLLLNSINHDSITDSGVG